jgi:hypothetical protein
MSSRYAEQEREKLIADSFVKWHKEKFDATIDYARDCFEAGESDDDEIDVKKPEGSKGSKGSDCSTCLAEDDTDDEEAAKLPLLYADYVVPADCSFESEFKLPNRDLGMNYNDKLPKRLQMIESKIIEMTEMDFKFSIDDEDIMIAKANMDMASDKLIKAEAALRYVNHKYTWQVEHRQIYTRLGAPSQEESMWHGLFYDMTRVFYKRRNMYWAAAENYYKAKSDKWKASQREIVPKQLRLGFPQMM